LDVDIGGRPVALLRHAREAHDGRPCSLGASSFPLVPYCGRLHAGRYDFRGRHDQWPLNSLPERHSSHGDGWMRAWELTELDRRTAVMTLEPDAAAPVKYRCTQRVAVSAGGVRISMTVRNEGAQIIPVGLGLHPYFASRGLAIIKAHLPVIWRWDHEMMPICAESNPLAAGFADGRRAGELSIAAEYADWDGAAAIEWPTLGARIELHTVPRLKHVVIWAPEGEDFFCFEPVSHATDALNGRDGHPPGEDFVILEPQAECEQSFDFRVMTS
jgi:aldose 1-epimerase